MKRERLEDLGRIYERMKRIIDEAGPLDMCDSKHDVHRFVEKYKAEEALANLHYWMVWHRRALEEIYYLAAGSEE